MLPLFLGLFVYASQFSQAAKGVKRRQRSFSAPLNIYSTVKIDVYEASLRLLPR